MHTKKHRKLSSLLPHAKGLDIKIKQRNDSIYSLSVEVNGGIEPYSYNWQIIDEGEPDHNILSTLTSSQLVIISNLNKSAEHETKQTNLKLEVIDASGYKQECAYSYITNGYQPLLLNANRPITASYCGLKNHETVQLKLHSYDFLDNKNNVINYEDFNNIGKEDAYFNTIEKLEQYTTCYRAYRDILLRYTNNKGDYENQDIPLTSNYTFADYVNDYPSDVASFFENFNDVLYELDPEYAEKIESGDHSIYIKLKNLIFLYRGNPVNINVPFKIEAYKNPIWKIPILDGSSIYQIIRDIPINFLKTRYNISDGGEKPIGKAGDIINVQSIYGAYTLSWNPLYSMWSYALADKIYFFLDQKRYRKNFLYRDINDFTLAFNVLLWSSLYLPLHRLRA